MYVRVHGWRREVQGTQCADMYHLLVSMRVNELVCICTVCECIEVIDADIWCRFVFCTVLLCLCICVVCSFVCLFICIYIRVFALIDIVFDVDLPVVSAWLVLCVLAEAAITMRFVVVAAQTPIIHLADSGHECVCMLYLCR